MDAPIFRNLPNPLNPGILHGSWAAHALGDSLGDDRLFELLVFLNGGLGALDDSVNLGTLAVKEGGDAVLFSHTDIGNKEVEQFIIIEARNGAVVVKPFPCRR